ncbi:prolipoprotein diacylglyceryl transferase [Chitinophaga vietnamensis]|uniref:prolipoprotein diacylglyceryl transferase n=1 Tax=Chitinophaga vietnamensis TaxID=2593957 RepID=UPI0011773A89|nr:prolipoprotein diacylglyceryl transferase [Chitinophaga vietnamensis]
MTTGMIYWNISPEIFRIGGFALRYYSLCFMLAFGSSYVLLSYILAREGRPKTLLDRLLIYVVAGTLLGARLGHCFFYEWSYFRRHLLEIILPFRWEQGHIEWTGLQGLASHGGAIGILAAVLLFSWRYHTGRIWLLDRLSIAIPLAGCFVRIGNFFNSEIVGLPSNLPWAVVFVRKDLVPRHPAQLYEALAYLLIFLLLFCWYQRGLAFRRPGALFGWLLVLVFDARFFIEFVKENQEAFENGRLLNMGQLLSLPLIAAGIFFLFYKNKNHGKSATNTGIPAHRFPGRG